MADLLGVQLRDALTDDGLSRVVSLLERAARRSRFLTHGDLAGWQHAVDALPPGNTGTVDLDRAAPRLGLPALDADTRRSVTASLKALKPWRKGPFELCGQLIDSEWRSDLKWARLAPALRDLAGQHVLDVGAGNGYFCCRALGAGAASVVGVDPAPLYVMQFQAIRKLAGGLPAAVLPLACEELAELPARFDTVMSMGVLYHRRAPIEHLSQLRALLRPGGQLVLESLSIEGPSDKVLVPRNRYARMRNVWFIPSVAALEIWLSRSGFCNVRCINQSRTTPAEQRTTEWMSFDSLTNALDPLDSGRTVEGYPAPLRSILIASCPA